MLRRIHRRHRLSNRDRAEHNHVQGRAWTLGPLGSSYAWAAEAALAHQQAGCETRIKLRANGQFQVKHREVV